MRSIRFSAVARQTPKSFHRGGFWCYLLSAQKVTYEKNASCHRAFRRGLASQTGGCRKRFHSFFVLTNKKCGMTRVEYSACCSQVDNLALTKFIFGGCGGGAVREPPKITPLCGATVRAAACGGPHDERMRMAGLRRGRLRPAQFCELHFRFGELFAARRCHNLIKKEQPFQGLLFRMVYLAVITPSGDLPQRATCPRRCR